MIRYQGHVINVGDTIVANAFLYPLPGEPDYPPECVGTECCISWRPALPEEEVTGRVAFVGMFLRMPMIRLDVEGRTLTIGPQQIRRHEPGIAAEHPEP